MTLMTSIAPVMATALSQRGYETLTPVQAEVIKPEYEGRDMLVSAQTGSGKTVAFGLAMANALLEGHDRLARADKPLALIIAPTRELALQVSRELEWLYADAGARMATCVGGMDMRTERQTLNRGAHIVVGTPGRLRDHIDRKSLDLSELKVAILDEADEMLNMGFSEDLEFILGRSPKERTTLMFSATVPAGILRIAKKYQKDAARINTAATTSQHADITYRALTVSSKDRQNAIINVLRYYEAKTAIVFCGTRAAVNHMTARFTNRGFAVVALSGELSQSQRSHALQAMRDGRARVCIATDVAARGIDLPDLELVIHADLPKNAEILLHRSGRTGRAGRKGTCILVTPHSSVRKTERLLRDAKVTADWAAPPSADDVRRRDNERLLADPVFTAEPTEAETAFVKQLLELYSPEQIAAAFVRARQTERSAPEELRGASSQDPSERGPRKKREDFAGGIWYELSVGRNHKAEPRWLLPMLFKAGNLEKGEVGAIKITQDVTYVEIDPKGAQRFETAIGGSGQLEKNTRAKRLDAKPAAAERGGPRTRSDGPGRYKDGPKKRDYAKKRNEKSGAKSGKPRFEKKEQYDPAFDDRSPQDLAATSHTDYTPDPDPFMTEGYGGKKTKAKKPHKKKLARAAARAAKAGGAPAGKPKAKPASKKPKGKPASKSAGKPAGKPSGKSPASRGGEAKLMRRKRKS